MHIKAMWRLKSIIFNVLGWLNMPTDPPPPDPRQPVNPTSLSIEDMSRLLSAAGSRKVTVAQVQADIDAGAPVGTDGRMNLVHYAAWLIREAQAQ